MPWQLRWQQRAGGWGHLCGSEERGMSAENAPSVCNCQKWGKRPKQIGLPESVGHRERAAELYHCPVQTGAGKQGKKALVWKKAAFAWPIQKQGREPQSPGTLVHVSLCSACSLTRMHPNFSGFLGHSKRSEPNNLAQEVQALGRVLSRS